MSKYLKIAVLCVFLILFSASAVFGESTQLNINKTWDGASLSIKADGKIAALYIEFNTEPGEYILKSGENSSAFGTKSFLHEYIDLEEAGLSSDSVLLEFSEKPSVKNVYAFDGTDVPSWVQKWEDPCSEADLLLISSHADDEQLFFSGILPYYTQVTGYEVQVAYATDHEVSSGRQHERLDGLWAVGVTRYPLSSGWPDLYSESFDGALANLKSSGVTAESVVEWIRQTISDTHAHVVVTHDPNGEYGHGMHKLVSKSLTDALEGWADSQEYLQKVYLHLYEDKQIKLWFMDEPFDELDGLTPFQVTQKYGFACHKSQHWTWFYKWIYGAGGSISRADQIKTYNPAYYGCVYSSVGEDGGKNDFFENVKSYAQIEEERLAEEARIAEEARLAEEAAKAEEAKRLEEARLAELARKELEEQEAQAKAEKRIITVIAVTAALFAAALTIVVVLTVRKNKRKARSKHGQK